MKILLDGATVKHNDSRRGNSKVYRESGANQAAITFGWWLFCCLPDSKSFHGAFRRGGGRLPAMGVQKTQRLP